MSNAKTNINTKTSTDVKNDIDAKIDIDVEIDMDTKTSIDLKFGNDEPIFDFPHTRKKINRHYISLDQSAGHEDGENGI
jgi:hypothetical protein